VCFISKYCVRSALIGAGRSCVMDEDLDDDFDLGSGEEHDPLDAENFNPVDYINRQFPNEAALSGLDGFVERLKAQQKNIDEDIRHAIRRQAACGRRARNDLDEAKQAVGELFERIKAIQAKAEQSETLVSDVCRDIKSLDIAKRNLTLSVTALKRLVMLVQALEQLRELTLNRRYREASGLIHAIEELAEHFQDLSHVARVADLLEKKAAILSELRAQLLEDFASLHGPEHARQAGVEDAACCVDAMGSAVRREVITQFCLRLLENYKDIFQPPKPASGLENTERRYVWLKKTVREFEEKHATHFPERWRVPCGLCMHFCHVTRQHLVEVLSVTHHTVDPELMVRVLKKSIDFENELARKYPAEDPESPSQTLENNDGGGASGFGFKYPDVMSKSPKNPATTVAMSREDKAEFAPCFRGTISLCFDAYLSSWVQHEEKQLLEALDRMTAPGMDKIIDQDDGEDEDDMSMARIIYSSSPELFANMNASMKKCQAFSTHQTLYDVFQVFRRVLAQYVERLDSQMPRKVMQPLDENGLKAACCVIGTAEYCDMTSPRLLDALTEVIDSTFVDRVTFSCEEELIHNVMNRANLVLVQSVSSSLDEAFGKMTRTNWAQFSQDVGDNSPYVGDISERLSVAFDPVARYLSKIHYRFFCDKFVQAFVARFISELYRCRKISEQGAQQLLLDTSFLKTTLLEAPVTVSSGHQMQTAYSNYVLREMGRAENMLKALASPDADAATVAAMLGLDRHAPESALEIERVLALRASSDGDVTGLLPPQNDEDQRSGLDAMRSSVMSFGDRLNANKASEDLKKNMNTMKNKLAGFGLPGTFGRKSGAP